MSVESKARKDAAEFARASLFHGEGAGVRRRLISTQVEYQAARNSGYKEAFDRALSQQDMVAHAKAAQRERRRKDVNKKVNQNARAIVTGRHQNLQTGLLVCVAAVVVARKTGLDKPIVDKTRHLMEKARQTYRRRIQKSSVDQ